MGSSRKLARFDVRSAKGRQFHPDLPTPATDQEKTLYVIRHFWPLTLISLISFTGITISQIRFGLQSPSLWVFLVVTIILISYFIISLLVNIGTRDFDLQAHYELVKRWCCKPDRPSIDVFLPVCGEPIEVIRNAWKYISRLQWQGQLTFYCLDDGDDTVTKALAEEFGFRYLVRPNRPQLQKAGNLLHAFQHSDSDFIVIFDADFCPRADMLVEMMAYFEDRPNLAIVQSPQYFRVTKQQGWLERGAGAVQELFYRMVQQSRQQRDAAICVGTNAIYRRTALEQNGGPTQIGHSEDVHTGFDLRRLDWDLQYIPIIYAVGICPSLRSSFLAQQYRWCMGSMSLLGSRKFWGTKMQLRQRCSYLSGFSYYLTTALLSIVAPLIPIVLLVFHPSLIKLHNYILILPSIIYSLVVFPLWHRHPYRLEALATKMIYGWAHLFAVIDIVFNSHKAWDPTGSHEAVAKSTKAVLTRQFNWSLVLWGGGTATVWISLAVFRGLQRQSYNFLPVFLTGCLYGAVLLKCLTPSLPRMRWNGDHHIDDDVVHLPHD